MILLREPWQIPGNSGRASIVLRKNPLASFGRSQKSIEAFSPTFIDRQSCGDEHGQTDNLRLMRCLVGMYIEQICSEVRIC